MADRISPKMARRAVAAMCGALGVQYSNGERPGWVVRQADLEGWRARVHDYDGGRGEGSDIFSRAFTARDLYDAAWFATRAIEHADGWAAHHKDIQAQLEYQTAIEKRR